MNYLDIKSYTTSIEVNGTNKHSITAVLVVDDIPAGANYATHTITWHLGKFSHTETIRNGRPNESFTTSFEIPMDWLNAVTGSTNGSGYVEVNSYSPACGNKGDTCYFTARVPSSCIPKVSAITTDIHNDNSAMATFGHAFRGFSKMSVKPTEVIESYGSPIESYTVICGGVTYTGNWAELDDSKVFLTDLLRVTGNIKLTYYVTDERGRSSEAITSEQLYVYEYSRPLIKTADAYRCNEHGEMSSSGKYMRIIANASIQNISTKDGKTKNTLTLFASWTSSANKHGQQMLENNEPIIIGDIDETQTYSVTITARDLIMETHAYRTVACENVAINVKPGGKAVAIGKYAKMDNRFEVAFPTYLEDGLNVTGRTYLGGADIHGAFQTYGKATDMIATYTTPGGETYYGDLNDHTYFGVYGVAVGTDVSKIYNAPCNKAGTLRVYSADGVFDAVDKEHHIIQEYVVFDASAVYRRYAHYDGFGHWTFNQWYCYEPI